MTTTPVGMRCPECAKQRTPVKRLSQLGTVPQVTYALIAINVIAFLAEGSSAFSFSGGASGKVVEEGGLLGSSVLAPGKGVAHGQWWRIVTSGFLHESLIHIGFNMWVLYVLGMMLEPAIGRLRFALIYAVALLTGSLGALLADPHSLTVGASGAVFGLMGAAAVEMRARQVPLMQSGVGGLIAINLIISFTLPNISWGGHVGGLIGGALAAAALNLGDRYRQRMPAVAACVVIAAAAVAGSIASAKSSEVQQIERGTDDLNLPQRFVPPAG
jgi:membrane associated rhomboid family serine protease